MTTKSALGMLGMMFFVLLPTTLALAADSSNGTKKPATKPKSHSAPDIDVVCTIDKLDSMTTGSTQSQRPNFLAWQPLDTGGLTPFQIHIPAIGKSTFMEEPTESRKYPYQCNEVTTDLIYGKNCEGHHTSKDIPITNEQTMLIDRVKGTFEQHEISSREGSRTDIRFIGKCIAAKDVKKAF